MKINKVTIVKTALLMAGLHSTASSAAIEGFSVGLDVLTTSHTTKDNYGSNIFGKNPTAFNAYMGYQLPYNAFLELGYETTNYKKRTDWIMPGDYYPGSSVPNVAPNADQFNTKFKIQAPYLGAGFNFSPFACTSNLGFFAMAGLSVTKINAEMNFLADNFGVASAADTLANYRSFKKTKG